MRWASAVLGPVRRAAGAIRRGLARLLPARGEARPSPPAAVRTGGRVPFASSALSSYRPLIAVSAVLAGGTAGFVVWLAMQAGPTLAQLETLSATARLTANIALPRPEPEPEPEPPVEVASADPEPDGNQGDEDGDGPPIDPDGSSGLDLRRLISDQADEPTPDETAPDEPAPEEPTPEEPTSPEASDDGPSAEPDDSLPPSLVDAPLEIAPIAAVTETSPFGELPKVGPDGEIPWRLYARPFDITRERPRIAIVVMWMGLDAANTENAIEALPPGVTLGFMPYPDDTGQLMAAARADGHETLMMLPMEPTNYPQDDPGPRALLTRLSPDMNRQRLEWLMGRASGYVGFIGLMGGAFADEPDALMPMLQILARRGLVYVDNLPEPGSLGSRLASEAGVARASVDRLVDDVANRDAIDLRLRELEAVARERGAAVGVAHPYPVTIDRLVAWAATLDAKAIDLAPVSALVNLQPDS